MLPIYSTYSFASSYLEPDAFEENIFGHRAQEDFDSYQSMPGGWCAPAHDYGVSPWAWQWSGEAAIQKVCARKSIFSAGFLYSRFMSDGSHSHVHNLPMV